MARYIENARTDFASKWTDNVANCGFTSIPNILLTERTKLNLTPSEILIVIALESFRWEADRRVFPRIVTISEMTGYAPRSVKRLLKSLEDKQLIKRLPRYHQSNVYDQSGIISKLNELALGRLGGQNGHPLGDDTGKEWWQE